jgi:hypothetical protein
MLYGSSVVVCYGTKPIQNTMNSQEAAFIERLNVITLPRIHKEVDLDTGEDCTSSGFCSLLYSSI